MVSVLHVTGAKFYKSYLNSLLNRCIRVNVHTCICVSYQSTLEEIKEMAMKWFVWSLEAWMKKNDFSVENGKRHLSSVIYPLVNTIVIIELYIKGSEDTFSVR